MAAKRSSSSEQIQAAKDAKFGKSAAAASAEELGANPSIKKGPSQTLRLAILAGIAAVLIVFAVVPVVAIGAAWLFSRGQTKAVNPPPQGAAKDADDAKPQLPIALPLPAKKSEGPPMSPEVRAAIDKGVEHLKKRLNTGRQDIIDGKHGGEQNVGVAALVGLALLEAKVPADDPAIDKVLTLVRGASRALTFNYSQAACLFFLNRLDEARPLAHEDRQIVRMLALRMLAGQKSDGRWFYQNVPITPEREQEVLRKLASNDYRPGLWAQGIGDNSQTQFSILALWGCRKHDLPVRPALLAAAAQFHRTQNVDGSWGYHGKDSQFNDSNTCAGLIALAMEKTLREDKRFQSGHGADVAADPKADDTRARAFARLAKTIDRDNNAPKAKIPQFTGQLVRANAYGDLYFLWCVERVGVIYDLNLIGGKDWYAWGSDLLLKHQRPEGSWVDRHGDVCDTVFAILFLTRANLAKDLTESIRTHGGAP